MLNIDLDLIRKYDKPGPRYTSYPTAPHFNESFNADSFLDEVIITNRNNESPDLSLYFHLPYCDTLCYFCGCNMIITRNRDRIKDYIKHVKMEIDLMRTYLNSDRKVSQLHWGGGTPTHLSPEEITDLIGYIKESFVFTENAEISCEIDPRGLEKEHLIALRKGGFNRISMGVQDFDEKVQKAVNRVQPEELTRQVVAWIRELEFTSINLDLIYGLPHQTFESFSDAVDKIIDIAPNRIAVFNYAHVPWMKKHMNLINPDDIPVPEVKLSILKMTIEKLTGAGYVFIGMDHFAKADDELAIAYQNKKLYRNFQGYSTNAGADLYAFGITSISQLGRIYSQNFKNEKEYYAALEDGILPIAKGYRLSDDDILRRDVIMSLMCDFELDFSKFENKYGINFTEYFAVGLGKLTDFIKEGMVELSDSGLQVVGMGRLLIRNIAINFDGYIEKNIDNSRYSKTV